MDENDVKKIVAEIITRSHPPPKPKMEFSKKLILGTLIYVGLFCAVSVAFWFIFDDWPREIAEFFIGPFIVIAVYMIKTAFENKAKIEAGKGDLK